MRLIDKDRLLTDRMKSKYYHLPNGDIAIPLIDIENAPTIEPLTTTWLGNYCPYTCKHCGRHMDSKTKYCPNCGREADNYEHD